MLSQETLELAHQALSRWPATNGVQAATLSRALLELEQALKQNGVEPTVKEVVSAEPND